jgi:hypothetical protein
MRTDNVLPVHAGASLWRYAAAVTLHRAISPSFSVPPFFIRRRAATKHLPR